MDVDLIFKIAAIGIIVAVLNQVVNPIWQGGAGNDDDVGRADCRFDDECCDKINTLFETVKTIFGLG